MTPERWQRIKTILADAREQPRAGREQWLSKVCEGDVGLQQEVEVFLAHEDELDGFIEEPIIALTVDGTSGFAGGELSSGDPEVMHAIGGQIGAYRLVSLLGEGGMGAVYRAERVVGFEQQVALKLVRSGLASPSMVRRFEDERQILARLEHPNIARLLDGGTSESGAPFFAMELIDGIPIDRYCNERKLTTHERLALFLPVCSALALAHQNLVIHRDLKPGNILVDVTGAPKLLDFGIAKLLTPVSNGQTLVGDPTHHQIMTPRYASPEQLRNGPVGTASDVYALGVVLYQVLTGHLPCRLESRDPVGVIKAVCDEDPLPASLVVRRSERITLGNGGVEERTPTSISRVRDGDLRTLRRRLSGDIDAILAKALRKDPRDRYPSVEQMASDLKRHLDGLPVLARQGDLRYRAAKFIWRHRLGLTSLATMVGLVLVFTVALVRQLHVTEHARDSAQEVSSFLIELFQAAAPDQLGGREPTVRDLLDQGREKLESGLAQIPEARGILLLRLGEVYSKLGDFDQASVLLTESIVLLRRTHQGDHADLASALSDLGAVHFQTGDPEAAGTLWRESLAMRQRLGDDLNSVKPMNNLASRLHGQKKFVEAEAIYRETLALRRAAVTVAPSDPEAHRNLATNLRSLAVTLLRMERLEEAEPLLQEALALRRELFGSSSTEVATVLSSLGRLELSRGRLSDAETHLSQALDNRQRVLGDDHWHTALSQRDLARLRLHQGDEASACTAAARAVDTLQRTKPAGAEALAEAIAILDECPAEDAILGESGFDDAPLD